MRRTMRRSYPQSVLSVAPLVGSFDTDASGVVQRAAQLRNLGSDAKVFPSKLSVATTSVRWDAKICVEMIWSFGMFMQCRFNNIYMYFFYVIIYNM